MRKTKIICTLGPASINEETIKTPENIGTYTYDDMMQYKSEVALKEAGKIRQEGKTYKGLDGDIMFFKFNV